MVNNTTAVNGSIVADFMEDQVAEWLWLHVAPSLIIIGLAGNTPSTRKVIHSPIILLVTPSVTGFKKQIE